MNFIKKFNNEEVEIYELCQEKEVDFTRIDYLLKNGADANAVEICELDDGTVDEGLLIEQCIADGNFTIDEDGNINQILEDYAERLLVIFINNGFDVEKHFNKIMNTIHLTNEEDNLINVVKLLLDNIDREKIDLDKALEGMRNECEFNLMTESDYEVSCTYKAIITMVEKYVKENVDYDNYDIAKTVIGKTIDSVKVYSKTLEDNEEDQVSSKDLLMVLDCEGEKLVINDIFAYVDNTEITDSENTEVKLNLEEIVGKQIVNFEYYHEFINKQTQSGAFRTVLTITLDDETTILVQNPNENGEIVVTVE